MCPPANGAVNFALDDALLARARETGREWIRVYTWDRAVLSFGRHESARGRYSPDRLRAASLDVARRQTGGRALVHGRELTYAIAGPVIDDRLRASYARIATLLAGALRELGVDVSIAERSARAPAPTDAAACFASPAPGELVVNGRKLVASAQWRERDAYLQHGSILVDNDQPLLETVLEDGVRLAPLSAPATLRELLPRVPTAAEFADALGTAVAREWGDAPERVAPEEIAPESAISRLATRYLDPEWTWRR